MKKITLALFAGMCCVGSVFGQLNYNLVVPPSTGGTSSLRAPNGSSAHAYQRTVFYIHPWEMLPMNLATLNSFSFQMSAAPSSSVAGNFTVWLSNTNDFEYAAGGSFSTAVTGMTQVYNGTWTLPTGTGTVSAPVNFSTPFNYTGNGLYVAYDWNSTGPFATSAATFISSVGNDIWLGSADATVAPVPDALGGSYYRPALIWSAVNTATNEVELVTTQIPGTVAKVFNAPQTITASIVNSSIGSQNNVSVTLNVTGPNAYNNVIVVPSMAAGSFTTVSFNAFNPIVSGLNQMSVSVALTGDQDATNNTKTWTQSVTCDAMAIQPANATFTTAFGYGGSSGSGYFCALHNIPSNASLTAIKANIGAASQNANKTAWAAVFDNGGSIVAVSTNTVNLTSSAQLATFNFTPEALTGGSDYYFGVAQPTSGYYPMAYMANNQSILPYYTIPMGGGAPNVDYTGGYFGIQPMFLFDDLAITVSASKTLTCKTHTPAMQTTLTATGANTYVWTNVGTSNTGSSVVLTPTVGGAAGNAVYSVIGTFTTGALAGCKSASSVITVSVMNCSSIMDEAAAESIKLFPNPTAGGKSVISGLNGTNTIVVYNVIGQVVLSQQVSTESTTIDLSTQPAGSYIVKITNNNEQSKLVKIINQN